MEILASGLIVLVALLHIGFLILEMFLWSGPVGQRIFKLTAQAAREQAVLAANQGLYNGFLAAGLLWSVWPGAEPFQLNLRIFFLSCVVIAGLYGWLTVSRTILFVQALPAAVALGLTLMTVVG